ncbi:hypothetical protein QOT17_020122 [Balamuthia mandrillaris]
MSSQKGDRNWSRIKGRMEKVEEEARSLFVYGTLRTDDDSEAPWTKKFIKGMEARPAKVFGASLYFSRYPVAVLDEAASSCVVGQIVRPVDAANWQRKLAEADHIEDYPRWYQRRVVEAVDLTDGKTVRCWIYHRTKVEMDQENGTMIAGGDWLKRERRFGLAGGVVLGLCLPAF